MKRAFLFVCFMSMLGIPAAVLSATGAFEPTSADPQSKSEEKNQEKDKDKDKDKDADKSAPAPPTLVLLGAAAAVAGASRFWMTRSRV